MVTEKKLERMAEKVIDIINVEYSPVDFIPNGFKVLLKKQLKEKVIKKVETKMIKEGFMSVYIDNEPEEGFTSNLTVIKFELT